MNKLIVVLIAIIILLIFGLISHFVIKNNLATWFSFMGAVVLFAITIPHFYQRPLFKPDELKEY